MNNVSRNKVRSEVKRLLAEGLAKSAKKKGIASIEFAKIYPAQKFLIRQAFIEHHDEILQSEFDELIPQSSFLTELEKTVLFDLSSDAPSIRLRSATHLRDEILGEIGTVKQISVLHPKTARYLVGQLKKEESEVIQTMLILALGAIYTRGIWWKEIFNAIRPFFQSSNQEVIESCIAATTSMRFDEKWEFILPQLNSCKKGNMMGIFRSHARNAPANLRPLVMEAFIQKFNSLRGKSGKTFAASAIFELVDSPSLARSFKEFLDGVDEKWRTFFEENQRRSPNRFLSNVPKKHK